MISSAASSDYLSLDGVEATCKSLGNLDFRKLERLFDTSQRSTGSELSPGEALVFWVANLLTSSVFQDPMQRWCVIEELKGSIVDFGNFLSRSLEGRPLSELQETRLPTASIGIADRRFVVMTGRKEILDVETGRWVPGASKLFLERMLYDLTCLYCRGHESYRNAG